MLRYKKNVSPNSTATAAEVSNKGIDYISTQGYDDNDCGLNSFLSGMNQLSGVKNTYSLPEVAKAFNERTTLVGGRLNLVLGLDSYWATPPWAMVNGAYNFFDTNNIPLKAVWVTASEEELVRWVDETGNPVMMLIIAGDSGMHWINFSGGDSNINPATNLPSYYFYDPSPHSNGYIDPYDPNKQAYYTAYYDYVMKNFNETNRWTGTSISLQNEIVIFIDDSTYQTLPTSTNTYTPTQTSTVTQTSTDTQTPTVTPTPSTTQTQTATDTPSPPTATETPPPTPSITQTPP